MKWKKLWDEKSNHSAREKLDQSMSYKSQWAREKTQLGKIW